MHNHITKWKKYSCLRFSLSNVSILNHSKVGRCVSIVHRLLCSLLCLLTSLWSIITRLQPAVYWISQISVEDWCSFSKQNFVHIIWTVLKKMFTSSGLVIYIKKIKAFLCSGIWRNLDFPNSYWLISSTKLYLHDHFNQGWSSLIEHFPKHWIIFKEHFECENYIRSLESKDSYILCKFRTTSHTLLIETGRFNNIDRANIICTKWDKITIGDEYHNIMVCLVWCLMLNATFNDSSAISCWSVLLVEETEGPGENQRPVASHWQTLSHHVVSSTPRNEWDSNSQR